MRQEIVFAINGKTFSVAQAPDLTQSLNDFIRRETPLKVSFLSKILPAFVCAHFLTQGKVDTPL